MYSSVIKVSGRAKVLFLRKAGIRDLLRFFFGCLWNMLCYRDNHLF